MCNVNYSEIWQSFDLVEVGGLVFVSFLSFSFLFTNIHIYIYCKLSYYLQQQHEPTVLFKLYFQFLFLIIHFLNSC